MNATINRKTRNAEPEIGPGRSRQTQRNPRVDGYGARLDRQEADGRVVGWFWNQTKPFLQSKPGPLAGYPDPLLTLLADNHNSGIGRPYAEKRKERGAWPSLKMTVNKESTNFGYASRVIYMALHHRHLETRSSQPL